eukprot:SAG31_NODE_43124_length_268_cov_0.917160_2_plen_47_part_01
MCVAIVRLFSVLLEYFVVLDLVACVLACAPLGLLIVSWRIDRQRGER